MKKCPYCGLQNDDAASQCVTCHTALATAPESAVTDARPEYMVSPQEIRFWERMTFRQFAVLMIRLQALWLLFNAAVDVTYLPRYLSRWFEGSSYSVVSTELKRELALAIFRIVLHVVAALLVIQHAERLLSWLVKDWVANPSFNRVGGRVSPPASHTTVHAGPRTAVPDSPCG